MLSSAGIAQHDPVLATLFRVERVTDSLMPYLIQKLDLDSQKPVSQALLLGVVRRSKPNSLGRESIIVRRLMTVGIRCFARWDGVFPGLKMKATLLGTALPSITYQSIRQSTIHPSIQPVNE